jgi:hypothetical protein
MEKSMKVILKIINCMDMGFLLGLMEKYLKENTRMV